MKHSRLLFLFAALFVVFSSSCSRCKQCGMSFLGEEPQTTVEACGDQLKAIEKTPGMVCK